MQFYLVSVLLAASSLRTQDGVITGRLRAAPPPTAPEREQRGGPNTEKSYSGHRLWASLFPESAASKVA